MLVTDRGQVIAELVPPRAVSGRFEEQPLAEAVRQGWLTPPVLPAAGSPPRLTVARLAELLRDFEADRDER